MAIQGKRPGEAARGSGQGKWPGEAARGSCQGKLPGEGTTCEVAPLGERPTHPPLALLHQGERRG
eukprot:2469324-Pyramimonas_sp.AAC.1